MPKSVTRSQALGSSAFRNDMVLPEQAPPCSHKRLAIRLLRFSALYRHSKMVWRIPANGMPIQRRVKLVRVPRDLFKVTGEFSQQLDVWRSGKFLCSDNLIFM